MVCPVQEGGDPRFPLSFEPSFHRMQGSQMIAAYVNILLCGFGILLTARYFQRYSKNDGWILKTVVGAIITLGIVETIFTSVQSYDTLVSKWGKCDMLDEIIPSVPGKYLCVYLTACIAQLFLASRIWLVGKSCGSSWRFMVIPVVAFSIFQLGGGLVVVALMIKTLSFKQLSLNVLVLRVGTAIQGGGSAVADVLITIGLVAIFRTHAGMSRINRSKSLLSRLARLFIHRAFATSILAVLSIFLVSFSHITGYGKRGLRAAKYFHASGTYYFMIPLLANTHVYIISVVAMYVQNPPTEPKLMLHVASLTSRDGIRREMNRSVHISDLVLEVPVDSESESHQSSRSTREHSGGDADMEGTKPRLERIESP
ncbi:hypothetical protein CC1G_11000 [Coprinopsis cinerea okayama7|uniref:Integral membrane protein n=1 Tax=Coprinopsis cinerea (strain Okayama-7 / 130 / ATCC MYA-4618 / FGSC 9003) TaxID=240176 RepID=A8P729_COPC7|nr:hypothetical protein CC1G_11000 [Coprinopsis cinerea okayama7\|eukprot:XP_001839278.2 hypothetical protein CC1G_11000 [Coprinopsis cinerea okayama7\